MIQWDLKVIKWQKDIRDITHMLKGKDLGLTKGNTRDIIGRTTSITLDLSFMTQVR